MPEFFKVIRDFITDYLPYQRNYSSNTVKSYQKSLNLLISFLRKEKHLEVFNIGFETFNRQLILEFLLWLEKTRNCGIASRNQRLTAIRSFFTYAAEIDCTYTAVSNEVLKVKPTKYQGKIVSYLSENALKALLDCPNAKSEIGLRNLVFMVLMYDTGARCSELLGVKIGDLSLNNEHPSIFLIGKGKKPRLVPLMPKTVNFCKQFIEKTYAPTNENGLLFYTTIHGKRHQMSPDTVAAFLKKYGEKAKTQCPEVPRRIHPHMLRHTRAMHYYQSGMPLPILAEYLGHADPKTTKIYAHADTEMKRMAMAKADPDQKNTPECVPIWENDEDMILRLSGLI